MSRSALTGGEDTKAQISIVSTTRRLFFVRKGRETRFQSRNKQGCVPVETGPTSQIDAEPGANAGLAP